MYSYIWKLRNLREILDQRNKYHVILCDTANILYTPFPIHATQLNNPFLNSMISANYNELEGIQPCNDEILYIKISFVYILKEDY